MTVRDPATIQEYNARFAANTRITGYGLDVAMHMPCPFCAAPEWLVVPVVDFDHVALKAGATCAYCQRSARSIVTVDGGSTTVQMVQTGGDPPPDYLPPMAQDGCPITLTVLPGTAGEVTHGCVLPRGHGGPHSVGDPAVPGTLVWHG